MQLLRVSVLACLLCSAFTLDESNFEAETFKEGDKDIMIVRDKGTGMVVTEIDVFEKPEYQLVKPVDEDTCLVAGYFMKASDGPDKPACFKRVRAPEDMQEKLQIDLSACKDREVLFLKPTKCRASDIESEDEQGSRQKRACFIKKELVSICVRTGTVCTSSFNGMCYRHVTVCVTRRLAVVTTLICS